MIERVYFMKGIVLSGSMQFLEQMKKYEEPLKSKGYAPILPNEDKWDVIEPNQINHYKAEVSRKHFDAIADPRTYAILVINSSKKGIDNYIGANTFAEIAIAFYFRKKIYLLNDLYKPFSDELLAWGAVALNGDINSLI